MSVLQASRGGTAGTWLKTSTSPVNLQTSAVAVASGSGVAVGSMAPSDTDLPDTLSSAAVAKKVLSDVMDHLIEP